MIYEDTSYGEDSEGNRATRHRYAINRQNFDALC